MAHTTTSDPDLDTTTNWLMGGICLAGALALPWFVPLGWVTDPTSPDFNPLILIPVLLVVCGVYFLVVAARATARRKRFGTSTLELTGPGRARMGKPLKGRIRTEQALAPTGDYRLALQCVDTHRFRKKGSRSYAEEFVVWEQVVSVSSEGLDSARGIPFEFQLPASVEAPTRDTPERPGAPLVTGAFAVTIPGMKKRIVTHNAAPESRKWRIEATAPMPGVDFEEYFLVTVD